MLPGNSDDDIKRKQLLNVGQNRQFHEVRRNLKRLLLQDSSQLTNGHYFWKGNFANHRGEPYSRSFDSSGFASFPAGTLRCVAMNRSVPVS